MWTRFVDSEAWENYKEDARASMEEEDAMVWKDMYHTLREETDGQNDYTESLRRGHAYALLDANKQMALMSLTIRKLQAKNLALETVIESRR